MFFELQLKYGMDKQVMLEGKCRIWWLNFEKNKKTTLVHFVVLNLKFNLIIVVKW
jgi:hypothetical protein